MAKAKPKKAIKVLDARERLFVIEYLIDLKPEEAALRAGYAAGTAHCKAYGWVSKSKNKRTKPHVYAEIQKGLKKREAKLEIDAAWVLAETVDVYEKSKKALDRNNSLKALDMAGKHISVQAFNERKTIDVNIEDSSDEELDAMIDELKNSE